MQPSKWYKRLTNLTIDLLTIEILTLVILSILRNIGLGVEQNVEVRNHVVLYYFSFFTYISIFLLYYFFMEFFTGKTLGKILTRSVVEVNNYGSGKRKISSFVIRTITRLLVFEVFYFFKKRPIGLHDKISKTLVVDNSN